MIKSRSRVITGISPLFNAIEDDEPGVINVLEFLLSTIYSVNDVIDTFDDTALHFATIKGRQHIVKYLLCKSADVNAQNGDGDTPLHLAIRTNNIPITKLLLDYGSDLKQTNGKGLTCFVLAIRCSNFEMIKFLVDNCQDITYSTTGLTPFEWAVSELRDDVVELLINRGLYTNVNTFVREIQDTPIHIVCARNFLLSAIGNGKMINDTKETRLKAERTVQVLIKAGAELNTRGNIGLTPVQLAIKGGEFNIVELLVKSGCDLNIPLPSEESSLTPLHLIVADPKGKKLVDLFLRYGADYYKFDKVGRTAYHTSFIDFKICQVFWKHGCPYDLPFFPNTSKQKPFKSKRQVDEQVFQCQELLFKGIKTNNVNTIREGLKQGAVVRGTSMEIKYPLHLVSSKGYAEVAKLLLEKGIKVNNLNNSGMTPLQLAIKYRKFSVCKALFQHGAHLDYKDEIRKLEPVVDDPGREIKDLLLSIYSWFILVKQGNPGVIELMKDLLETDEEMFLVHLNALDKNKRSIMALAMSYGHGEIVQEIMKHRLHFKSKLYGLRQY